MISPPQPPLLQLSEVGRISRLPVRTPRAVVSRREWSGGGGQHCRVPGQPWVVELALRALRGAAAFPSYSDISQVLPGVWSYRGE